MGEATRHSGETGQLRRVTLTLDLPQSVLDGKDDFGPSNQGITVAAIAANIVSQHDAEHGYIHFTVNPSGGSAR